MIFIFDYRIQKITYSLILKIKFQITFRMVLQLYHIIYKKLMIY